MLVERSSVELHADAPDPQVGLAFEDVHGVWWIWEPTFDAFHTETPWVRTDFYHRARERTDEWIDVEFGEQIRFTELSAPAATTMLEARRIGGAGDRWVQNLRGAPTLRLEQALEQIQRAPGPPA
jgi:hypothetical protein